MKSIFYLVFSKCDMIGSKLYFTNGCVSIKEQQQQKKITNMNLHDSWRVGWPGSWEENPAGQVVHLGEERGGQAYPVPSGGTNGAILFLSFSFFPLPCPPCFLCFSFLSPLPSSFSRFLSFYFLSGSRSCFSWRSGVAVCDDWGISFLSA